MSGRPSKLILTKTGTGPYHLQSCYLAYGLVDQQLVPGRAARVMERQLSVWQSHAGHQFSGLRLREQPLGIAAAASTGLR